MKDAIKRQHTLAITN